MIIKISKVKQIYVGVRGRERNAMLLKIATIKSKLFCERVTTCIIKS